MEIKVGQVWQNNKDEKFYIKDLYEAEFYKKQNFKNVKNKLKKDNVKIKYLLGNNGIIS